MVGSKKERTHKEEHAHQECHGSHRRISKEEAEEESEIFLQDLPEVKPQYSGLLEESKYQSNTMQGSADVGDGGEGEIGMA